MLRHQVEALPHEAVAKHSGLRRHVTPARHADRLNTDGGIPTSRLNVVENPASVAKPTALAAVDTDSPERNRPHARWMRHRVTYPPGAHPSQDCIG